MPLRPSPPWPNRIVPLIACAISAVSIHLGIAFANPLESPPGARHRADALSKHEIVAAADAVRASLYKGKPAPETSVGLLPPSDSFQLLLVERRQTKTGRVRQSDVYHYDYDANELVHSIVHTDTNSIVRVDRQPGVQLPLVQTEIDRATAILMASGGPREQIDREYTRITGKTLNSINDIDYKAFVFHADATMPDASLESKRCGTNRCAQLLLHTADDVALDLSPIVDLSLGLVTEVLRPDIDPPTGSPDASQGFGGQDHAH